jgi:hypothetical protein
MSTPYTRQLSIAAAIGFAAWVVWLWVDPLADEQTQKKPVEIVKPQMKKPVTQQPENLDIYVLPAPPVPIKVASPPQAPKPVVKKLPPAKSAPEKDVVEVKVKPKVDLKVEPKRVQTKPVKEKLVQQPKKIAKKQPENPKEVVHEVTRTEAVSGRALLRVLEHGKGPQIEIAWPQNAQVRDTLYDKFQNCFGMENALMDGAGNLFRKDEPRGQRWEINLDRFSGFLRQASGRLPRAEERKMNAISYHHGHLNSPVPVRIFPRRVDASLLGGLKAIVGDGYMKAKSIQAQYDANGLITDIRIDGRMVSGRVKLSQFKRCSWRV